MQIPREAAERCLTHRSCPASSPPRTPDPAPLEAAAGSSQADHNGWTRKVQSRWQSPEYFQPGGKFSLGLVQTGAGSDCVICLVPRSSAEVRQGCGQDGTAWAVEPELGGVVPAPSCTCSQ